jgi:hypothetical protein
VIPLLVLTLRRMYVVAGVQEECARALTSVLDTTTIDMIDNLTSFMHALRQSQAWHDETPAVMAALTDLVNKIISLAPSNPSTAVA